MWCQCAAIVCMIVAHARAHHAVTQMLASAQQLSMQQQASGDEDLVEYNNSLRAGIFEAYAGMLNGLPAAMVNQVRGGRRVDAVLMGNNPMELPLSAMTNARVLCITCAALVAGHMGSCCTLS